METGSEPAKTRRCPTCHGSLEGSVAVCPYCGRQAAAGHVFGCVVVRGGERYQDAVVTPTGIMVERSVSNGLLTKDQGEFLMDLLMRIRPLTPDRRKEFSRVVTEIARESDRERRRNALWELRGLLRGIPALEDTVHALFVRFEL